MKEADNSNKKEDQKPEKKPTDIGEYGGNIQIVYWAFVVAIIAGGIFYFTNRFVEFDEVSDKLENDLKAQTEDTYKSPGKRVVLGVNDGPDNDSSDGDEENSELPVDDSGEDSAGDSVVAEADSSDSDDEEVRAQVDDLVDEIEEERKQKLRDLLHLQLPDETDNPNHAVTFTEPTDDGVEIQVDGEGFSKKKSPYQLPSLAIGMHTIHFRFKDDDKVTQNLEEKIVIIPRAPVFNESQKKDFRSDESLVFEGTALPHSKIVFLVSSDVVTNVADVDSEGNWKVMVKENISKGDHSAFCFVRKDGYASNFSEVFEFTVGEGGGNVSTDGIDLGGDNGFSLSSLEDLINEDNIYYVLGGAVGLSMFLIFVLYRVVRSVRRKRAMEANMVPSAKKANGGTGPGGAGVNEGADGTGGISLREKFMKIGITGSKGDSSSGKGKESGKGSKKKEKKGDKGKDLKKKDVDRTKQVAEDSAEKEPEDDKDRTEKQSEKLKKEKKSKRDKKKDKKKEKLLKGKQEKSKSDTKESDSKDDSDKSSQGVSGSKKVYSKEEFLKEFKDGTVDESGESKKDDSGDSESNKINITLTSR